MRIRILRSPYSNFYHRDIEDSVNTHPDWYLESLKEHGFNGIWLHCILRNIVRCRQFSEFGKKEKEQIDALNKIIEKAAKYNIRVFLYFCEPRGFKDNETFWKNNSDVRGQPFSFKNAGFLDGTYYALCTSTNRVKDYLYESSRNLFKKVQGLAGIFMITASEFHTHCYSHYPKWKLDKHSYTMGWLRNEFICERCRERNPSDVVAEIITIINQGIKSVNKNADVIAWSWSWNIIEPDPQKRLIQSLPEEIILMCDWERGGYKKLKNKKFIVDEYSFSYTGPSPRFKKQYAVAREKNIRVMAKIQVSTTHELVSVPYIPVPHLLAEKIEKMRKMNLEGYLGCWIFGGEISPMSKIAGMMSKDKKISKSAAIRQVAQHYYGKNSSAVTRAWKYFSYAWKYYPFSIPFLYYGPINYATIYPFYLKKSKNFIIPSWQPLPRDKNFHLRQSTDLSWAGSPPFTVRDVIYLLNKMLETWKKGINQLETVAKKQPSFSITKELNLAIHIGFLIESTKHIIEFCQLIGQIEQNKKEVKKILERQLEIAEKETDIIQRYKFGYHPEAHEFFITVEDLKRKIRIIRKQLMLLSKIR